MNIDKILVPTDFSECAQSALKMAINLAKKTGAEIHLLHSANSIFDWMEEEHMMLDSGVLPNDLPGGVVKDVNEGLIRAEAMLNETVNKARSQGVKVAGHFRINLTHKGITSFCRDHGIELIIMGSRGTSGFVSEMIGSNAQKIARTAQSPVIFVKDGMDELSVKRILYPSTFEEESELENLEYAAKFAEFIGARIDLLFVNTPHYFEETKSSYDRLHEIKKNHALSDSEVFVYDHFTPEDGILAFVEQNEYEMICMSKFQFTGWKRFSKPLVVEPVINHADIPVMSLHVKGDQDEDNSDSD